MLVLDILVMQVNELEIKNISDIMQGVIAKARDVMRRHIENTIDTILNEAIFAWHSDH